MKDPRIASMDPATMPFDAKRMFWGGFESVVELGTGEGASAGASGAPA